MKNAVRIRTTDDLGSVAYIHREQGGRFQCTLASGIPAAFSYAGISDDEMGCRFALDDCITGHEALAVAKRFGSPNTRYELRAHFTPNCQEPFATLSVLEAEVQRLKALIPAVFEHVDNGVLDRARALLTGYSGNLHAAGAPAALYLHLYHGRKHPEENIEDWGSEGPTIGPLAFVQATYLSDVKFAAAPEVMDRFFPAVIAEWRKRGFCNAAGPLCHWQFTIVDDLIEYDGVYYGDWTVFQATPSEIEAERSTPNQNF